MLNKTGELVGEARKLLLVKEGRRGLRQSEMVFQHTKNLPALFEEVCCKFHQPADLVAIGVTGYPRPIPGSYMPAFLVGDSYARVLAKMFATRLYRLSHQENHIFAGIWSAGGPQVNEFLAVHLSGGTTEIVHVNSDNSSGAGISLTLLGGSKDIHAGQFVDRVGVALGLPFPAGPYLEQLACKGRGSAAAIPISVQGLAVSFAGPETSVRKLIDQKTAAAEIAAGVELCIARSIAGLLLNAIKQTKVGHILMVGGVAANQFIRAFIAEHVAANGNSRLYFPEAGYSPDNAVGAAYFALKQLHQYSSSGI
ncbi:MAG TPA: O-sialoglycoprotein endopeptidase [Methylomusa anaerophila]|nr:O-sialoglycoprotein endopeptidase [Methylomusa anaerophila]